MNIVYNFDYFNVLYEVEVNGKCCVPIKSHNNNYAVFLSPNEYSKVTKKGFRINIENKYFLNYTEKEFRKLICSDRIIRIYSKDESYRVKTIMYAINSSFYERNLGERMFT